MDVNIFSSLLKTSRMKTDWFFFVCTKTCRTASSSLLAIHPHQQSTPEHPLADQISLLTPSEIRNPAQLFRQRNKSLPVARRLYHLPQPFRPTPPWPARLQQYLPSLHEHDTIYKAIVEAATQNECDRIFMASHGHRGIGALLLGSETAKVLAHSKIPILVYRDAESAKHE